MGPGGWRNPAGGAFGGAWCCLTGSHCTAPVLGSVAVHHPASLPRCAAEVDAAPPLANCLSSRKLAGSNTGGADFFGTSVSDHWRLLAWNGLRGGRHGHVCTKSGACSPEATLSRSALSSAAAGWTEPAASSARALSCGVGGVGCGGALGCGSGSGDGEFRPCPSNLLLMGPPSHTQ